MANRSIIDGFAFADDADVSLASDEIEKIKYIAGKMNMENLSGILKAITEDSDVVGFTIAEYLPFDEHRLHKMLSGIKLFTE